MRAFEVYLNRKRLCTAGVGSDGVLSVSVHHVIGKGRDEVFLEVGGLISSTEEHLKWRQRQIHIGDEVCMKVIESAEADRPRKRRRRDPDAEKRYLKRYVRAMAKQLGWQITPHKSN